MIAEPPVLSCRDDALVDKGAEAPKFCLSTVEMRTPTADSGLLPTGTASIAMRNMFSPPPPSWTIGDKIGKETAGQTLTSLPLFVEKGLKDDIKVNSGV